VSKSTFVPNVAVSGLIGESSTRSSSDRNALHRKDRSLMPEFGPKRSHAAMAIPIAPATTGKSAARVFLQNYSIDRVGRNSAKGKAMTASLIMEPTVLASTRAVTAEDLGSCYGFRVDGPLEPSNSMKRAVSGRRTFPKSIAARPRRSAQVTQTRRAEQRLTAEPDNG